MQLGEGIDAHPESPRHVTGRRFAERRKAELERVPAHRRILEGAGQRLDRHTGRRQIGIARAHVDEVHALLNQPPLDRRQLLHRIGG